MKDITTNSDNISSVLPIYGDGCISVKIPDGTSFLPPKIPEAFTSDSRRIPYGFLSSSPHPGFDPERLDKNHSKQINNLDYGRISSDNRSGIPLGYTTKRMPILYHGKEM